MAGPYYYASSDYTMTACLKLVLPLLLAAMLLPACSSRTEPAAVKAVPLARAPLVMMAPDTVAPPPWSAAERARQDTIRQLDALIQARYPRLKVFDFECGDINADGRRDIVVVTEAPCDSATSYHDRTALLLLNPGPGRLRIAAVNAGGLVNSMPCEEKSYEGYTHVTIQARTFTFHGSQPHTGYEVVFRYDKARRDWFLYRRISAYYPLHADEPDVTRETPRNFGRVRFADYEGGVIEF